jgi:hypothetical protein
MLMALRRDEASRRLAAENLKVCPLCGAVNAHLNSECFVCRWHGDFSQDPDDVEDGVLDLLCQCPELIDAMVAEPEPKRTFLDKVRTFFYHRRVKRKLDLLA